MVTRQVLEAVPVERVAKVGHNNSQDCNGEGNFQLLPSFDITILHIAMPYLRHPLHRFAVPLYLKDKATASALKRRASAFP